MILGSSARTPRLGTPMNSSRAILKASSACFCTPAIVVFTISVLTCLTLLSVQLAIILEFTSRTLGNNVFK